MKTILQEIENRIAEHQRAVDFWEEKIKVTGEENTELVKQCRAQRGHVLAAIEELKWMKKLFAECLGVSVNDINRLLQQNIDSVMERLNNAELGKPNELGAIDALKHQIRSDKST